MSKKKSRLFITPAQAQKLLDNRATPKRVIDQSKVKLYAEALLKAFAS